METGCGLFRVVWMSIQCVCPDCGRILRVGPQLAGKRVRCPDCSATVSVSPTTGLAATGGGALGEPATVRESQVGQPETSGTRRKTKKSAPAKPAATAVAADSRMPQGFWLGLTAGAALVAMVSAAAFLTRSLWWPVPVAPLPVLADVDRPGVSGEAVVPTEVQRDSAAVANVGGSASPDVAALLTASEEPAVGSGEFPPNQESSANNPADAVSGSEVAPGPSGDLQEMATRQSAADSEVPVSAPAKPPQPVLLAQSPEAVAEAAAVAEILKSACYRCHGESGTNEGGMNYVASLSKVRDSLVRPGDPGGSLLMQRIDATDQAIQMPPAGEEPRLTAEQTAVVRSWIQNGAAIPQSQSQRQFITDDMLLKTMHEDLMAQNERSRRFMRYFTLTHLYNGGASDEELQTHRLAFSKLINSLSWGREIVLPYQVDEHGTILRLDIRDLTWSADTWDQIAGVNPYPFEPDLPETQVCTEQCGTFQPWIRADWFVFKASQPPLYHTVLRIPETEQELEQMLHVEAQTNIDQEQVVRAGFNRSGVSRNNRLIERHNISYGAYWKSYDFAANTGRQNLFDFPQGPVGPDAFKHDGGEFIFSLPNGLHAYMLVDGQGARLDSGPTAIVSDPATHDRTVINGVSCFSCHFSGIIRKTDEIRPFLEVNAASFANAEFLKSIYPGQEQLDQHYVADAEAWLKAVKQLGIINTSRAGEPISSMSQRFQAEVSTAMAAAEFGLTEAQFLDRMSRLPDLPRSLGALRVPGGTMKRDSFTEVYREAAAMLKIDPTSEGAIQRIAAAQAIVPRIALDQVTVLGMAFQPNGSRVVVATQTGTLVLADTRTGKIISTSQPLTGRVFDKSICFSADGRTIVAATGNGQICVFDVANDGRMNLVWDYDGHVIPPGNTRIHQLLISRDGTAVLSVCTYRRVHIWNPRTRRTLRELTDPLMGEILAAWLSSDGRDFRLSTGRNTASGSSRGTRPLQLVKVTDSHPGQAVFSANGKLLMTDIVGNRTIALIDSDTGKSVATLNSAGNLPFNSILLCNAGNTLLLHGFGRTQVWDLADQTLLNLPDTVNFSRQSRLYTAADNDIVAWLDVEGIESTAIHLMHLTAQTGNVAVGGGNNPAASSRRRWRDGEKAEIRYGASWAPVTVLCTNADRTIRIHWDGWSNTWDQDVQSAELRPREAQPNQAD